MDPISILAEYNTEGLRQRLLEFPRQIWEQKSKVEKAQIAVREIKQEISQREAEMATEIAAEKNPDNPNKATFSNVEARAAELLRRKKADPECQRLCSQLKSAEWDASSSRFDLERLQDDFKASRYVADLMARELAVLAAGMGSGEANAEVAGAREDTKQPW